MRRLVSLILATIFLGSCTGRVDRLAPEDEYWLAMLETPPDRRFERTVEFLREATDETLLRIAIQDILIHARHMHKEQEALDVTEAFLDTLSSREGEDGESALLQRASLTRASLLLWLNRMGEAKELFYAAMRSGRTGPADLNAYSCYIDALVEAGELREAVIEQYNCAVDVENAIQDGELNLLTHFLKRLLGTRQQGFGELAVESILPALMPVFEHPEYGEIAEALCWIADGEFDAAANRLTEIQASLAKESVEAATAVGSVQNATAVTQSQPVGEWRNIPLYIATARTFEAWHPDKADAALDEFLSRNWDRPEYVLKSVLDILYLMRSVDVTDFLLNAGFVDDPELRTGLSDATVVHLLGVHAEALREQGRWREAKAVSLRVVEEFFPGPAGAEGSLLVLSVIHRQYENNESAALAALLRILAEGADKRLLYADGLGLETLAAGDAMPMDEKIELVGQLAENAKPRAKPYYRVTEERFRALAPLLEPEEPTVEEECSTLSPEASLESSPEGVGPSDAS